MIATKLENQEKSDMVAGLLRWNLSEESPLQIESWSLAEVFSTDDYLRVRYAVPTGQSLKIAFGSKLP